jgi:hypothetical protein
METKLLPCPSELVKRLRGRAHVEPMGTPDFWMLEDAASYIERTAQGVTPVERRVIDAACGVVAADTYKHPILSRDEAVKAGVAELHDAVRAYQSAQPACAALNPKPEVSK